jgi:tetratricopeptide (TPR) repeat protein
MTNGNRLVLLFILGFLTLSGCVQDSGARKAQAQAKQNLGIALLDDGNAQAALKNLLEAVELDPENESLHFAVGRAYAQLEHFERAEFHLNKALQIKPNSSEVMNHLGIVYSREGKYRQAAELFRKAGDDYLYTSRFYAYNNLGSVHLRLGEYEKALDAFKKAVQVFPQYSQAYDNMGMTYEALKDWDRAIESYQKSIQYTPDYPISYLRLANVYIRFNRREEARALILKAMEVDRNGDYGPDAKRLLQECERRG